METKHIGLAFHTWKSIKSIIFLIYQILNAIEEHAIAHYSIMDSHMQTFDTNDVMSNHFFEK